MREKTIHQIFDISVTLKGLHALVEIASGLALYLVSTATVVRLIDGLTRSELIEDPHDFLARHVLRFAEGFSAQTHHFYAFYLLSHGLVKGALVIGLLRQKLWAYPASFVVFGAFIAYQIYRYSYTHEFSLILLSLLDLFVIALAIHEYRLLRRHLPTH
jgi:uncharacterized membrane protein